MPTYRQKLVASKLLENGGNIGKVMIAASYSPSTAKTPQKLTQSKGWKELMDVCFPDELIVRTHRDALTACKIGQYTFPKSYSNQEIKEMIESSSFKVMQIKIAGNWKRAYFLVPDHQTRMIAVKEAYKVKDRYPRDKIEQTYNEELEEALARMRKILPK